ncbi:MAG: hypothetical protein FJ095_09870 [Deltaproteobacteria bacterium]|nr:hypothetical protein [Deltaproteobacteria bacterium]
MTVRALVAALALVAFGCGTSSGATFGAGASSTAGTASAGSGGSSAVSSGSGGATVSSSGGDAVASTGSAGGGEPETGWRSALYPKDWAPGFASADGLRVQDYSYAGYRRGEAPIGAPAVATIFEVATFGADPSGAKDATGAFQAALNAAKANGGGVVHVAEGTYRLDGTLAINASNIVLRGEGPTKSRLAFRKSAGMSFLSHITFAGNVKDSGEALLTEDAAPFLTQVKVTDASAFAPGDDVVVGFTITGDFIAEHQMVGTWDQATNAFKGKWQPFFRREVVSVDTSSTPHTVTLDVPLRYPAKLRDGASLKKQTGYLSEVAVESLGLANAVSWDEAWAEKQVHVLELRGVKDSWIRDVASFSPPSAPTSGLGVGAHLASSGLLLLDAKRVTVADSGMHKAENRGSGGNGYLYEVRQSNEILFRDLVATEGRHNFIQNWGFGVTGCVWVRVTSQGGVAWVSKNFPGLTGASEFHHSLALGNLIDSSRFDDGWAIVNRGSESTYSGHTGTENVVWNVSGTGTLRSRQFGHGYVIGSNGINVQTTLQGIVLDGAGTAPEDYTEGLGKGAELVPQSLYEDQLARRLGAN